MEIYRIFTSVDYADTCRDPSNIHITELGYSNNLEEAKLLALDYIKNNFFHKNTKLNIDKKGNFYAIDFCSYGEILEIETIKTNENNKKKRI